MTRQMTDLQTHWPPIAPLFALRDEDDYDVAVARLNSLLDEIGTNQQHPLYSLLDTLGTLIHTYEVEHHTIPNATGREVLEYLMAEHGVSVNDLPEIGPADVVNAFLAGECELTVVQVRALSRRFHTAPGLFIGA